VGLVCSNARRSEQMNELLSIGLIYSTIRTATPLLLAALGGLCSERSGVINIALEGLMLAGAFTAAVVTHYTHSPWIGLAAAIAAGIFIAAIHAVLCIQFKANQVVSGMAINILMIGIPALLSGAFFESTGATPQIPLHELLQYAPVVIALAPLIFGKWRPVQTMLACLLFGFAEALATQMQGVVRVPVQFIQIIPYVLTMIVLAGFIGLSRAPRALGIPYQKEK